MIIGERIKTARHLAGLSLRDLAGKIGVSAQAISKYERGKDVPSSRVLLALSRTLGVGVEFFVRPTSVGAFVPAYRKRSALSKKQERAVLARVQEWLERYIEVETLIQGGNPRFAYPDGFPHPVRTLQDVERAAAQLRLAWSLGLDPIGNLTEVLEDHGVKVGLVEAPDDFDAVAFKASGDGAIPVIVARTGLPGDRHRFSLAHELAHVLLEPDGVDPEVTAHRFAAAVLVPEEIARFELGDHRRLFNLYELHLLKRKYGLSMQTWIHRAQDLGIISAQDATRLFREFRRRRWHIREPGEAFPQEQPTRLERLVMHAFEEGIVSRPRAAELLGRPLNEFFKEVRKEHGGLPVGVHN